MKDNNNNTVNMDLVPKDYEEAYNHYFKSGVVKKLMGSFLKFGTDEEFMTLESDIFERMMEKDVIKGFNPEKANFGGVVFFVTRTICVNYLSRKSRDPLGGLRGGSLVEMTADTETFVVGTYNLGQMFESDADTEEEAASQNQVLKLSQIAQFYKDRNQHTRDRNLLELVDLLHEGYTKPEISTKLKVTQTTISNWIAFLAKELKAA